MLKRMAGLVFTVFALVSALAGPTAGATPAVQEKVPPAPGAEQKAPAPPSAPGPAIEAIQARLPEVSARLGREMAFHHRVS